MKKQKLKKLRKGHIWPSVVFLIFSMMMAVLAAFALMVFVLTFFADERLENAYQNVQNIQQMFSTKMEGTDDSIIMKYLEKKSKLADAVYILDERKNSILGYGGHTYNVDSGISLDLYKGDGVNLYSDTTSQYFLLENGDLHVERLLEERVVSDIHIWLNSWKDPRSKEAAFEEPMWLEAPLPGNKTIIIKDKISFSKRDLVFSAIIGVIATGFMLFPLLFLFINVVRNVVQQRRMTNLLYTNPVTGGRSWLYLRHQAERLFHSRFHKKNQYAIADISLMKYRSYCNYHGVNSGEELLEEINEIISSHLDKKECCAYYGKASFALLLKCERQAEAESRIRTILKKLEGITRHNHLVFHAGIYYITPVTERKIDDSESVADYYNQACLASASVANPNQSEVVVFDRKLLEEQLWEHKIEEKMQQALDREEFQVYLQPKYNPVNDQLVGAEALVRWNNEEDGFIVPGRFIPIFEKNGFITKLDDYMISHVAKLQAEWLKEGKKLVPVSVNVSRAHFANPNLAKHICRLVDEYELPHEWLEIELTESAFFDDKQVLLNTVRELKEVGFDVSMDDFGSGYSSLNSLKDLPLDVLKLDAEFFRGEDDDEERGKVVVSEAIQLAKKLNMRIVAEGVEKKAQVDFLADQECDMIQGYFYAKPMPYNEYYERLE